MMSIFALEVPPRLAQQRQQLEQLKQKQSQESAGRAAEQRQSQMAQQQQRMEENKQKLQEANAQRVAEQKQKMEDMAVEFGEMLKETLDKVRCPPPRAPAVLCPVCV